ncbi:arylsulfatase [uncultured Draconibacterium sp.]|uniref:arylsulfatase n=1 Tax=uncultured Draconibacterium sp. TaxID=1573823 RepID=UPI0025F02F0A|nr:arylsulfatase [uncultured Draconibacterium sp.]
MPAYSKKIAIAILFILGGFFQLLNAQNQPNVVLIVTDDQGYGDLSCHGNPVIKTPHLDKLHEESVRFTNFHVDPTCAASRAALMTGKYAHRVRVWRTVSGGNHLRATETTMADVFKASGYRTAAFGKWHLGANYPYRPMDRGFGEWLGHGDGGTGTTDDWFDNDRVNDYYWHNGERIQKAGYAPDVFFNAAINFIQEDKKAPFFIYLATYLPHSPHTIPDTSMVQKYKGKIHDKMAFFFAGIDRIDQNIGKLRSALEESGKADNTIFIFMTDNGGTEGVPLFNASMRGSKAMVYDGGHRVPFFVHWPNGDIKHGSDVNDLTAHFDVLPTLIDLCDLVDKKNIDFDGRSFKQQLKEPELKQAERTLFVEKQWLFKPKEWLGTVGMTNRWRLVDNKELYDIQKDPAQKNNIINEYPEVVKDIRESHKKYWARVTPGDRDKPLVIIGHKNDPEIFLSPSDWFLTDGPWNHGQVAVGRPETGAWDIAVAQKGTYRFEVRRWPREANAPIQGIPTFTKKVDAYDFNGEVDKLIYGKTMKALPVASIKLKVGKYDELKAVKAKDTHITFDVKLKRGDTFVKGVLLDKNNEIIAGAYYVYVTKLK